MITAPDYGDQHVRLQPMSGARLDDQVGLGAFGGGAAAEGAARAAQGASTAIGDIAKEAWQHGNQLKVLDADNQMNMHEVQQVYDPKNGALTKRGMDAFNLPETVMKDFDKKAGDVAATLTNDEQRISFTHLVNARRFMLERVVGRHVDNELKTYNTQVTNDSVKNASDMAVANYSDPDIVSDQIGKQKAVLTDFAVRNGIAKEVDGKPNPILSNMVLNAVSTTHSGVIRQFAENGLSEVAQQYLTKNREEMTPKDTAVAEDTIRRRIPQDVASRIYQKPPALLPDGSPDRFAAQKAIDGVAGLDQEQKLAAFNAFEAYANHDAIALKRTNDSNDNQFYSKVTDMANKGQSVEEQKKVASDLVAKFQNGAPDQYDLSKKYAFIEQLQTGAAAKNDPETLISIHQGMLDGSITDSSPILKAMKDGLLSKATATQLAVQMNSGRSEAMSQQWKQITASAEAEFPIKDEKDAFISNLRAQAIEGKVSDPAKLKELYDKNMATAPSGSKTFFGMWNREPEYYKTQQAIHQNPALVKAMGGGEAAFKLVQMMGGPENFAPDSLYSKATIALVQRGAKPGQIMPSSIEAVISKHPEWVK